MRFDCVYCEIESIENDVCSFCPRCRAVFRIKWAQSLGLETEGDYSAHAIPYHID